jgi:hypothetical protein
MLCTPSLAGKSRSVSSCSWFALDGPSLIPMTNVTVYTRLQPPDPVGLLTCISSPARFKRYKSRGATNYAARDGFFGRFASIRLCYILLIPASIDNSSQAATFWLLGTVSVHRPSLPRLSHGNMRRLSHAQFSPDSLSACLIICYGHLHAIVDEKMLGSASREGERCCVFLVDLIWIKSC